MLFRREFLFWGIFSWRLRWSTACKLYIDRHLARRFASWSLLLFSRCPLPNTWRLGVAWFTKWYLISYYDDYESMMFFDYIVTVLAAWSARGGYENLVLCRNYIAVSDIFESCYFLQSNVNMWIRCLALVKGMMKWHYTIFHTLSVHILVNMPPS